MSYICEPATDASICIGSIRSAATTRELVGEDKIVATAAGYRGGRLLAEEGATLEKGAPILTLEVMKMEQTLRARRLRGVLKVIKCKVGDIVQEGVETRRNRTDAFREQPCENGP